MSIERAVGLTVPEKPTGDVDQGRVHDFIRQIFILNGCLDAQTDNPSDYFKFKHDDRTEKRNTSSRYFWAGAGSFPLVFTAIYNRHSQEAVEARQRIASRQSDGFITESYVGSELFRVSELSPSEGVNGGQVLFGTSFVHVTGASHFYDASVKAEVFGTYWNDIDRTMLARPSDAHVHFLERITQRLSTL